MKRLMILSLLATAAWSSNYTQMSTEELFNMRGSITESERPVFRAEMQKRMQAMTPQERQALKQPKGMGQGKGRKGQQNRPNFSTFDLNKDGKISQKEFDDVRTKRMTQKANKGKMMRNAGNAPSFESIDTNSDGSISPEEFQTQQMKHMGQGKMR
jgi:hypothetical protein